MTYTGPFPRLSVREAAYASGVFDGEGCITIAKYENASGNLTHSMTLTFSNTCRPLIDWMQSRFPGGSNTHVRKRRTRVDGTPEKQQYVVTWRGPAAVNVLRQTRPFMIVKGAEADVAIDFQERLVFGRKGRGFVVPASVVREREKARERLQSLKR